MERIAKVQTEGAYCLNPFHAHDVMYKLVYEDEDSGEQFETTFPPMDHSEALSILRLVNEAYTRGFRKGQELRSLPAGAERATPPPRGSGGGG